MFERQEKMIKFISLYIPLFIVLWEIFLSIVILLKIPCKLYRYTNTYCYTNTSI